MKKSILFILLIIVSCKPNGNNDTNIVVDLEKAYSSEIAFDEWYNTMLLSTLKNSYPEYYQNQLESYGLTEGDSIIISTLNTDYRKFKYDLFKAGFIKPEDYITSRIDSLVEKDKPEQRQFVVGVSFENDKYIMTVDSNNNKNFADDRKVVFTKEFMANANDEDKIKNLATYDLNYWSWQSNKTTDFNRKVIVYPHANYSMFPYTEDTTEYASRLVLKFKDYWKGSFKYDGAFHEIYIQGVNSLYSTVLIKPDSIALSNDDPIFNNNFAFKPKDTVNIQNDFFVIDSLNSSISKLYLNRIEVPSNAFFSHRMGYKVYDFNVKDLNKSDIKLSQISDAQTEFILLDFWGTWCKPCLDFTPQLKSFYNRNKTKVKLLSVALDNDLSEVKEYVSNNEMNWNHAFVNRQNRKNSIIDQLSVKHYPNYILLDKNLKILYRGVGDQSFNKIKEIIENN